MGVATFQTQPDGSIRCLSADPEILVTLELLAQADPKLARVEGSRLLFPDDVDYHVIGWDADHGALRAIRVHHG